MRYDYFAINFPSFSGFLFLLIFLSTNSSLEPKIKRIFYLMIGLEFVEMLTYSLELWTTTFAHLSPLRLWLSAIGYTVRPFIFLLMLMLAQRNTPSQKFSKGLLLPAIVNAVAAFSVFFTDLVYSYTPDNQFQRGPLGYITYVTVILYLITLVVVVIRSHVDRPKLEIMIIPAIVLLLFLGMAVEAIFAVRTINRTAIIMATTFYYMFFQTQVHNATLTKEQHIRRQLEHANRLDGSTGLLNKKAFADLAKALLFSQEAQRPGHFGFLFLDLDNLKKLNDTLGHAAGDTAIADTAATIQSFCRKTDLIGRFGGDEFCVLLPDIPRPRFCAFLNDLQAGLQIDYSIETVTVAISASMGAVYVENLQDLSYERLVQLADEALYEAKASGRNCHIIRDL